MIFLCFAISRLVFAIFSAFLFAPEWISRRAMIAIPG
jgi:hypothetical protein